MYQLTPPRVCAFATFVVVFGLLAPAGAAAQPGHVGGYASSGIPNAAYMASREPPPPPA